MGYEDFKPRSGRGGSRGGSPRRGGFFGDGRKGRGRSSFGRDSDSRGPRRELQMTKVTCSECGIECEVPFKPTSSKPVYCRDCFEKKGDRGNDQGSGSNSSKEFEKINEKLDKIMRSLSID